MAFASKSADIDDAMHVIYLYIQSREEYAPALSLAWRELDAGGKITIAPTTART